MNLPHPNQAASRHGLSRRDRRELTRRAERTFEKVRGTLIEANATCDWVFVEETGGARRIPGAIVPTVLTALGLADFFYPTESERLTRPFGWLPALVVIDGEWATVNWIESYTLSSGGVA